MMDGFVGPTQEEIFSHYHSSTHQMMYYTNMWAMLLLTVVMLFTGDGTRAVGFVVKNPAVLSKIMQFGLMSATGQFFIFFLVRSFSALTLVTVTTTRKFFTVLASVFWFQHKLTLGQWLSVAFVFSGLAWEEASKYIAKQRKKRENARAGLDKEHATIGMRTHSTVGMVAADSEPTPNNPLSPLAPPAEAAPDASVPAGDGASPAVEGAGEEAAAAAAEDGGLGGAEAEAGDDKAPAPPPS
jgi:hypothetical protein